MFLKYVTWLWLVGYWGQVENVKAEPKDMAEAVRQEFLHAWNGYKTYAWGYDELKPLSKSGHNWGPYSLLITPIEALDTMLIMGLDDEAELTREYIATNLSFDHDMFVSTFEITIRVLGGLISAYQMTDDKRLLDLAEDLGRRLLPAFFSPTGMPYTKINLRTGQSTGSVSNAAEVGTSILEFGMLSQLTGNPIFHRVSRKALFAIHDRRSALDLIGASIDVNTGEWLDTTSHIGGGSDSYYEYLFKCWKLFDDAECKVRWIETLGALNKHLAIESWNGNMPKSQREYWYRRVDMNTGNAKHNYFSALDAFFAGTLVLHGDLVKAEQLQRTYYRVLQDLELLPETYEIEKNAVVYALSPLRPEMVESAYYLYKKTKDPVYRKMGASFFKGLKANARTSVAYATVKEAGYSQKVDQLESFFFAETLKYLYLLFAEPETIDLTQTVFSTEAHLFQKAKTP